MNTKLRYALNAVLYGLWNLEIRFDEVYQCFLFKLISIFAKLLSPKKYHKKISQRIIKCDEFISRGRHNPKSGYCIGWANSIFGLFYCSFPFFISCLIFGIIVKMLEGNVHPIIIAIVLIIPISALWYPAKKAVYDNNIYLEYFKIFEKEDESWHKKWKRIAIAFCIGGILCDIAGMYMFFVVAIGRFDLWNITPAAQQ